MDKLMSAVKEHKQPITDPIEKTVAEALTKAGIGFKRLVGGLDFTLDDGTQIECKAFFSDRIYRQAGKHRNAIVIQGYEAARSFARMLEKRNG